MINCYNRFKKDKSYKEKSAHMFTVVIELQAVIYRDGFIFHRKKQMLVQIYNGLEGKVNVNNLIWNNLCFHFPLYDISFRIKMLHTQS